MLDKLKKKIYSVLEETSPNDLSTRLDDIFLATLILLNILAVILQSVEAIAVQYSSFFWWFEVFSVSVFTVEYLLRVWLCTLNKKFEGVVKGRLRYILTPLALFDLIAILPFYLPMLMPFDLRFMRVFRLARILRIFKMSRYSNSLKSILEVLGDKKEELVIVVLSILMLLVFASSAMYVIEHDANPQAFSSIPAAMWWGVVTLTTVGYGDVYPITPVGKLFAAFIAILGIGLFALPAGIIASGFNERIRTNKEQNTCPHCGKEIKA